MGLSKDAHWEGDATSWLREATATYAGQHTATFISVVEHLSSLERANLITFLADVENHISYKEYQQVINNLTALGQDKLAKEFEAARRKRARQPHD